MNRQERRKGISAHTKEQKQLRRDFEAGIIHVNIPDHPTTEPFKDGAKFTVEGYEMNGKPVIFVAHRKNG